MIDPFTNPWLFFSISFLMLWCVGWARTSYLAISFENPPIRSWKSKLVIVVMMFFIWPKEFIKHV